MRRGALVATLLATLLALSGCGEPEQLAVPSVVGQRLDTAYDMLEEAGFSSSLIDTTDRLEDRGQFSRGNWVVVDQSPEAEAVVSEKADLELGVVKLDDPGAAAMLPEDSPVLAGIVEAAEQEAAEEEERRVREEAEALERSERAAAEQQEELAQQQADIQSYVEQIDPAMLLGKAMIEQTDEFADRVRSGAATGADFRMGADTVNEAMSSMVESMEGGGPPASTQRGDAYATLEEGIGDFSRAAQTLLSASGSTRDDALARYDEIWPAAVATWNDGLTRLYEGTGINAPLVDP